MLKVPDGTLRILVQGGQRVNIEEWESEEPYLVARIYEAPDVVEEGAELTALMRNVQQMFSRIIDETPYLPEELQMAVANVDDPSALSHLIAGSLRIKTEEKQELLEERDVAKRLRRLSEILARELEVAAIGARIQSQVQSELDKSQREYLLREQLKAIQEELGERDPAEAEVEELREQLAASSCPRRSARSPTASSRGWRSCRRPPPSTASSAPTWSGSPRCRGAMQTEDNLDLEHAREQLDADHYDIERVKDRIIEFLAVRRLKPDARGSILCFVGPPGVGKTSLGRSIAARAGAQVRAHLGRRHARRGRDPRPPPHLHRRDAGRDRAGAARRRRQQPGLHDRRDRQDGRRLPRRPGVGDARGARPGAERRLPRPLPRHRRSTSRA